ncbi:MAG: hypothetical protein QOG15_1276 [Solirubrobacteraceae bacterium]|jgi:glycosyltransferase involved in cell wall biosynthesis|nr:hypothetical protein [Solirubrobacteraceae bacterium]
MEGLTIVLTRLDQADGLPDVVAQCTHAAERCARAHEIVLVDEGSSDATVAAAGELVRHDPRVRLIVHGADRGHGDCVRTGIAAARLDWVLLMDADARFDVGELEDALAAAAQADLVVGRWVTQRAPVVRRTGSALWNRVVRPALDLPARDVDCAFRLGRRELLQRVALQTGGALGGAELINRGRAGGDRIEEVRVHHRLRAAGLRLGHR